MNRGPFRETCTEAGSVPTARKMYKPLEEVVLRSRIQWCQRATALSIPPSRPACHGQWKWTQTQMLNRKGKTIPRPQQLDEWPAYDRNEPTDYDLPVLVWSWLPPSDHHMNHNSSVSAEGQSCGVCCRLEASYTNRSEAGKTCEAHVCIARIFKHLSDPPFPEHTLAHTQERKTVAVNFLCACSICSRTVGTSENRNAELELS